MDEIRGSVSGIGFEAIIYYVIALLGLLIVWIRAKKTPTSFLFVFLFSEGVAAYLGYANIYRLLLLLFVIYLIAYHKKRPKGKKIKYVYFFFAACTFLFFYSVYENYSRSDYTIIQAFAQYAKIITPFLLLLYFLSNERALLQSSIIKVINQLIVLQIVMSFIKLIIIGPVEGVIGTIAYTGGHYAALFPCLAFLFYWYIKGGNFNRRDWLKVVLLTIIGVASFKRAIWFIYPTVILFSFLIQKDKLTLNLLLKISPLIIVLFILGVKLNPSLNPEGKAMGSFDLEYVYNYANDYTFGKEDLEGYGRGGGLIALLSNPILSDNLFGLGFDKVFLTSYETFDVSKLEVAGKGSLSGISSLIVSYGFIFSLFFILYSLSIVNLIENKSYKVLIIVFMLWELILYKGSFTMGASIAIVFMLIISFYEKKNIYSR